MTLLTAIAIGLGGAAGALTRAWVGRGLSGAFPLATLAVNVLGCFLLAAFTTALPLDSAFAHALLGSGFCGAFTTFSTFILETVLLFQAGEPRRALAYLLLTLFLCSLASWLGISLVT